MGASTLPQEIREEIPPQEDLWSNAPGDPVWQYDVSAENLAVGLGGFSWQVRKLIPGKHFHSTSANAKVIYEASTRYRACYYDADSPEAALGALLRGMCLLSRDGAINPNNPYQPGSPPIQHAMHILTERLLQAVELRADHMLMSGYAENPQHVGAIALSDVAGDEAKDDEQSKRARDAAAEAMNESIVRAVARDNEVIAALGTAISALARVKDL